MHKTFQQTHNSLLYEQQQEQAKISSLLPEFASTEFMHAPEQEQTSLRLVSLSIPVGSPSHNNHESTHETIGKSTDNSNDESTSGSNINKSDSSEDRVYFRTSTNDSENDGTNNNNNNTQNYISQSELKLVMRILRTHFPGIKEDLVQRLCGYMQIESYQRNELIYGEGSLNRNAFFILLSGIVEIRKSTTAHSSESLISSSHSETMLHQQSPSINSQSTTTSITNNNNNNTNTFNEHENNYLNLNKNANFTSNSARISILKTQKSVSNLSNNNNIQSNSNNNSISCKMFLSRPNAYFNENNYAQLIVYNGRQVIGTECMGRLNSYSAVSVSTETKLLLIPRNRFEFFEAQTFDFKTFFTKQADVQVKYLEMRLQALKSFEASKQNEGKQHDESKAIFAMLASHRPGRKLNPCQTNALHHNHSTNQDSLTSPAMFSQTQRASSRDNNQNQHEKSYPTHSISTSQLIPLHLTISEDHLQHNRHNNNNTHINSNISQSLKNLKEVISTTNSSNAVQTLGISSGGIISTASTAVTCVSQSSKDDAQFSQESLDLLSQQARNLAIASSGIHMNFDFEFDINKQRKTQILIGHQVAKQLKTRRSDFGHLLSRIKQSNNAVLGVSSSSTTLSSTSASIPTTSMNTTTAIKHQQHHNLNAGSASSPSNQQQNQQQQQQSQQSESSPSNGTSVSGIPHLSSFAAAASKMIHVRKQSIQFLTQNAQQNSSQSSSQRNKIEQISSRNETNTKQTSDDLTTTTMTTTGTSQTIPILQTDIATNSFQKLKGDSQEENALQKNAEQPSSPSQLPVTVTATATTQQQQQQAQNHLPIINMKHVGNQDHSQSPTAESEQSPESNISPNNFLKQMTRIKVKKATSYSSILPLQTPEKINLRKLIHHPSTQPAAVTTTTGAVSIRGKGSGSHSNFTSFVNETTNTNNFIVTSTATTSQSCERRKTEGIIMRYSSVRNSLRMSKDQLHLATKCRTPVSAQNPSCITTFGMVAQATQTNNNSYIATAGQETGISIVNAYASPVTHAMKGDASPAPQTSLNQFSYCMNQQGFAGTSSTIFQKGNPREDVLLHQQQSLHLREGSKSNKNNGENNQTDFTNFSKCVLSFQSAQSPHSHRYVMDANHGRKNESGNANANTVQLYVGGSPQSPIHEKRHMRRSGGGSLGKICKGNLIAQNFACVQQQQSASSCISPVINATAAASSVVPLVISVNLGEQTATTNDHQHLPQLQTSDQIVKGAKVIAQQQSHNYSDVKSPGRSDMKRFHTPSGIGASVSTSALIGTPQTRHSIIMATGNNFSHIQTLNNGCGSSSSAIAAAVSSNINSNSSNNTNCQIIQLKQNPFAKSMRQLSYL